MTTKQLRGAVRSLELRLGAVMREVRRIRVDLKDLKGELARREREEAAA